MSKKPSYEELEQRICEFEKAESERIQTEKAFQEGEEFYRELFEAGSDAFFLIDNETGSILKTNKAASDLYGYSQNELQKLTNNDLSDEPDSTKKVTRTTPPDPNFVMIIPLRWHRKKDGTRFPVEISGRFFLLDGRAVHVASIRDISKRLCTEEELRTGKKFVDKLIDSLPGIFYLFTREGKFQRWNRNFEKLSGRTADEIREMHPLDFFPVEEQPLVRERIDEVFEEGESFVEANWLAKDGSKTFCYLTGVKVDVGGTPCQVGMGVDISELKRTEEALRESEEIIRNIIDSSPLAIQLFDNEGYTLTVNPAHTKMFGSVPPADYSVLNDPLLQKAGLQNDIVRVSKGEIVRFPDMHYNPHDILPELPDNPVWSSGLGFPLFDSKGNVNNFVMMHQDVTERKRAEKVLKKNNKELFQARSYLEAVIDNANVWLNVIDREGNVVIWNKAAEQISGYSRDEVIGSSDIWEWSYPDIKYREEVYSKANDIIEHGEEIENFETIIRTKNNESRVLSWHSRSLTDEDGESIGSIAFGRDVTKIKHLEKRLNQAQKMEAIGTLAGGIAHDFNNILAAILGYAEMARDDSPPGSTVARDLDKVLKGGKRAKDLVQQILAFSRQNDLEKIPLQPVSVVKEAVKILRPSLPTTIEINQDISSATGQILADPTQIHQIVMNLCTNAFHAMEENGGKLGILLNEVHLRSEDLVHEPDIEPGIFIQLSISDSGPGIPPDIKKKIFDPYFTTKETGKGTGMGLAIVHGIVKSYGGFISLYSDPGEGTGFHVFLPVIEKKLLADIEDVEPIPVGRDRILFIDDEEILADMGKSMLERLGYHVTVRNNSIEALETFQHQPDLFDLVITDQTMPGMAGADLARRMMQIRPDIPIILCTGYSTVISEEKAKSMGIKEFALKPLSKKDIAVLVRKVLDNS